MILEAKRLAKQEGTGLKILTPKQMRQRLPIALAQIKSGNNSKSLLNEIKQIVYSLYQSIIGLKIRLHLKLKMDIILNF